MLYHVKLIDIELSDPATDIEALEGYTALKGLVRLHGTPLGYVQLPIINGRCTALDIRKAVLEQHHWPIIRHLLGNLLANPSPAEGWGIADLLDAPPASGEESLPLVTVAVCTRDRADDLALCLEALNRLDYPNLDILIVDNAPGSDATERLVRSAFPHMRYVCEPRPGLDWARNRAIVEARGEIIAYTDDDVVVDPGWVTALARVFVEDPAVMAVTGLVVPYELETEAQLQFEWYGGFGRGFVRKWYQVNHRRAGRAARQHGGTGKFGTGANMAYRRSVFERIGLFDPALDVGTVANGGGDLEMFFRILKEGYSLVYEPAALVRHRHRRDYARLRAQIANNGIGFYAYLVRSFMTYPDERRSFIRLGLWWLWWWNIRRLLLALAQPSRLPIDLMWAELKGSFIGLGRYQKARRAADQIAHSFGPAPLILPKEETQAALSSEGPGGTPGRDPLREAGGELQDPKAVGVRAVDLNQPLTALTDVAAYAQVRLFVILNNRPLGSIDIPTDGQPVSVLRLREAIIDGFGLKLIEPERNLGRDMLWAQLLAALNQRYLPSEAGAGSGIYSAARPRLPVHVPVSVVVATHDRTDDLRDCLRSLVAQETERPFEIIIVDNNPASGVTPPVVAEFPGVKLISEPRKGLSYARNAGITASRGDIVVATDDDVVMPPTWLENLVAPFARPDVMIVTGNTLPLELATHAQRLFEKYGGLGRGFETFEVGRDWFESFEWFAVPTWKLGATANAAFRTAIFHHPEIGLMDEALGVGTPTGCSEDTYLFYQVLQAGYTLLYEPTAYVWHKHRRTVPALRRQIYGYSKGHVAYHLTTLFRYRDLRALLHVAVHMPRWHFKRVYWYFRKRLAGRKREYPLSLTLLEISGNLAGPWALWRSRRRVKREGHSQRYIPVSQRLANKQETSPAGAGQPSAETSRRPAVNI